MTNTRLVSSLAIALACLALILQTSWAAVFIHKWTKKDSNIIIRNPVVTLFFNLAIIIDVWIICTIVSRVQVDKLQLRLLSVQNSFILSFIMGPYVVKTFELFYRFFLAEEIFALKSKAAAPSTSIPLTSAAATASSQVGWFLRNRYLITIKWQILLWIPWVCLSFSVFSFNLYSPIRRIVVSCLYLISLSAVAVLFWKMRGKVDVWGIKKELRNVIVTAGVGIACYIALFGSSDPAAVSVGYLIYFLCLEFVSFHSVGYPAIVTFFAKDDDNTVRSKSMQAVEYTLSSLLNNKVFMQGFENWLKKAFSSENLSFINDVDRFLENLKANGDESVSEAIAVAQFSQCAGIIETYVRSDGLIPVNISSEVRNSTIAAYNKIKNQIEVEKNFALMEHNFTQLFSASRREIFCLLETDSLPRYMATEEFKKFKEMNLKVDVILSSVSADVDGTITSVSPSRKAFLPSSKTNDDI